MCWAVLSLQLPCGRRRVVAASGFGARGAGEACWGRSVACGCGGVVSEVTRGGRAWGLMSSTWVRGRDLLPSSGGAGCQLFYSGFEAVMLGRVEAGDVGRGWGWSFGGRWLRRERVLWLWMAVGALSRRNVSVKFCSGGFVRGWRGGGWTWTSMTLVGCTCFRAGVLNPTAWSVTSWRTGGWCLVLVLSCKSFDVSSIVYSVYFSYLFYIVCLRRIGLERVLAVTMLSLLASLTELGWLIFFCFFYYA